MLIYIKQKRASSKQEGEAYLELVGGNDMEKCQGGFVLCFYSL